MEDGITVVEEMLVIGMVHSGVVIFITGQVNVLH